MQTIVVWGRRAIGAEHPGRWRPNLSWVVLPFLLTALASEGLAAPARLETTPIRVRYNRSELNSPAAARNLLMRIGNAALESCGASRFSLAEFKAATVGSRCWKAAVNDAVRSVGSPELSAAEDERR